MSVKKVTYIQLDHSIEFVGASVSASVLTQDRFDMERDGDVFSVSRRGSPDDPYMLHASRVDWWKEDRPAAAKGQKSA